MQKCPSPGKQKSPPGDFSFPDGLLGSLSRPWMLKIVRFLQHTYPGSEHTFINWGEDLPPMALATRSIRRLLDLLAIIPSTCCAGP